MLLPGGLVVHISGIVVCLCVVQTLISICGIVVGFLSRLDPLGLGSLYSCLLWDDMFRPGFVVYRLLWGL